MSKHPRTQLQEVPIGLKWDNLVTAWDGGYVVSL